MPNLSIIEKIPPTRPKEHIPTNDEQADRLWIFLTECWSSVPVARPTAAKVRDEVGVCTYSTSFLSEPTPKMRAITQARLELVGTQFGAFIGVPGRSHAWTNLVGQPSPDQVVSHSERVAKGLAPADS